MILKPWKNREVHGRYRHDRKSGRCGISDLRCRVNDCGIDPSLTVKFIKTPLKALFYLGFQRCLFVLLYSLFSESDMDNRLL